MNGLTVDVLARIPGWEDATAERLEGGRSDCNYRLRAGNRSAVLKFDHELRDWPGNSRPEEADVQRVAAAAGLAATVSWYSEEGILTDWLDGDALGTGLSADHELLFRIGGALRQLHGLPCCGRHFDLRRWADFYRERLERHARFDAAARTAWQRVRAAALPGPRVLSHNDLVPGNIVVRDRPRFIDWEYACDNSWLFDLATLHVEAGLDSAAMAALLEGYTGVSLLPEGFADAVAAYRALVELWEFQQLPAVS